MRMRLLKFLLLLTITTPLLSKAEEVVVSGAYLPKPYLNLKYEQEFDFDFCIKNATLCKKIEQDQTNTLLPKFEMYKRPKDWQWRLFWTLQTLDVLTTAEGLSYDCIAELNPLLGDRPSTLRLIAHKGLIFGTSWDSFTNNTSEYDLSVANFITGIAVINNIDVINGARDNCNKIR